MGAAIPFVAVAVGDTAAVSMIEMKPEEKLEKQEKDLKDKQEK